MIEQNREITTRLAVLGHPVRFAIIRLLVQAGPAGLAAGHLSIELETAPNALTFHLQKLQNAGLVTSQRQGQFIIYSAAFQQLTELSESLVGACCANSVDKCSSSCPTTRGK